MKTVVPVNLSLNASSHAAGSIDSYAFLDVFRGWAAVLMLVNHAGYRLLADSVSTAPSFLGALIFFGSFAPVLFFFSTGFGIGASVRFKTAGRSVWPALWKGGLLLVADQFFWYSRGISIGLDFFGFIGITTIFTTLVVKSAKPLHLTVTLILVLLALRFLVGPLSYGSPPNSAFLNWIIGSHGLSFISYPLSPWMIYPLIGLVVVKLHTLDIERKRCTRLELILNPPAIIFSCLLGAAVLYMMGKSFFRWGTVSFGFFVLSIAILSLVFLMSKLISNYFPFFANILSLRGASSFLIIPVHYALLDLFVWFSPNPLSVVNFSLALIALIFLSFSLAGIGAMLVSANKFNQKYFINVGFLILAFVFSINYISPVLAKDFEKEIRFFGQVLIAGMLVFRPPFKRAV